MLGDDLEAALLGAACRYSREDVAEQVGVRLDEARSIWAAMGLAEVPDGELAFTDADVAALRTALELRDSGIVDPDTLLVLARAMGQGLARLAEAQVEVFRGRAAALTPDEARLAAATAATEVLPRLEQLVVHVWRRQFAAATERSFAALDAHGYPLLAVGFVDLVGYTRTSRETDAADLQRMLEKFERETSLRVTACGGRVVKTLGDAVLYVSESVFGAAEVALDTVAAHEDDESLPEVRAGLALGPVLPRLGDVYGEAVNLASRLTDEARPSSVLVDAAAAEALAADASYTVHRLKQRAVRGYRALRPYVLRRRT